MTDNNFTIRTSTRPEVEIAVEWAATEGWNPGIHDADCYYSADSAGFFIGLLDSEPIATISAINYSPTFGFIGFYIVKPKYRGKGYGIKIWNEALKKLGGRNIGLDGVTAQQENYERSGFKLAHRNIRYEGISDNRTVDSPEIIKLSTLPFETIETYDRPFFPADRSRFIRSWVNQPEGISLGILQNRKLAGYGVMRACRTGYKIGPLFANSSELADLLFLALRSGIKTKQPIYLDVPEVNQAGVSLAKRHNMEVVFETARMYTGKKPNIPLDRVFGVTSFEIG